MSKMPDIKSEVNVTKERDEKKGGLLGLLSRLSGGGGAGGASGGIGGLGGAAASGGLLATKAGLIGLILAGTTVAGGLGIGAWSVFGPGPSDGASNPALQLFASKPKDASASASGVAPVAADGSSQSLSFLAKANAPSGEASVEAPPADASAAVTDGSAANAASATPHMGESVATNVAAPKVGLQGAKKLGELSKSFGGGGSGGSASASAAPVNNAGATASNSAGAKGALGGGMARGTASQSIGRGLSRARGGSATRQAMGALGENRRAFSSQAGGRTYDGGSATGGTAGVDAGLPSGGPGVNGSGGAQPTSTPNTAANTNEFEPPPTPEGKNVTPYQKAINMSAMLLGAAAALLFAASMLLKTSGTPPTPLSAGVILAAKIMAGLALAISLAVVALGAVVSGGKYGQQLQGGILAVGGLFMAGAAALYLKDIWGLTADTQTQAAYTPILAGDIPKFVMLCGGAGLVATAGALMSKPRSYPASEFDGRKVPDAVYIVPAAERSRYTV